MNSKNRPACETDPDHYSLHPLSHVFAIINDVILNVCHARSKDALRNLWVLIFYCTAKALDSQFSNCGKLCNCNYNCTRWLWCKKKSVWNHCFFIQIVSTAAGSGGQIYVALHKCASLAGFVSSGAYKHVTPVFPGCQPTFVWVPNWCQLNSGWYNKYQLLF